MARIKEGKMALLSNQPGRGLVRALHSLRDRWNGAQDRRTHERISDQTALVIEAALYEYSLLHDEILHIRSRQSQLVVFVGAGVGAVVSSTFLTTYGSDKGSLAAILFVAALVVGAAVVNYIGNTNTILLIGSYLAERADEIRSALKAMPEPHHPVPPGLFTWDRRVQKAAVNFLSPDGITAWVPASFELVAMAVLGLSLWLSGIYVMNQYPSNQRDVDFFLLWSTSLVLPVIVVWTLYGLHHNQQRSERLPPPSEGA
jgi:uncharacterized membrane protein YeaQ/YmgE (transglycosylase-associated protein family)